MAIAATGTGAAGPAQQSFLAWFALALFALALALVALEEQLHLRKSKPVLLAAALIWFALAWSARGDAAQAQQVAATFEGIFLEYAELFFFLVVSMIYVDALAERGVFDALRGLLARRALGWRALFWFTGAFAFALSFAVNNMTTALVAGSLVMAVGAGNPRFVAMGCVNIVVAANAGGAWSAFGDITTLMVWQAQHAGFFDFFRLFAPALCNWLVPAVLMSFALPSGDPPPAAATGSIKTGGAAMVVLFAATIAISVAGHEALGLPPVFGMLAGLALLQWLAFAIARREKDGVESGSIAHDDGVTRGRYDLFAIVARVDWDTLLFFGGILLAVGALAELGWLRLLSAHLYGHYGPTAANTLLGLASAIVDNIPVMSSVLQMNPNMELSQWLLIALTCGVGGSLLSIGSAAGIALMGAARSQYTFASHLRWSWAIALGFVASVLVHLALSPAVAVSTP